MNNISLWDIISRKRYIELDHLVFGNLFLDLFPPFHRLLLKGSLLFYFIMILNVFDRGVVELWQVCERHRKSGEKCLSQNVMVYISRVIAFKMKQYKEVSIQYRSFRKRVLKLFQFYVSDILSLFLLWLIAI